MASAGIVSVAKRWQDCRCQRTQSEMSTWVFCRALAARQVGEYLPWQIAGPIVVKMKNLLALEAPGQGCADAFNYYMLANVTTPFVAGLSSGASFGFK